MARRGPFDPPGRAGDRRGFGGTWTHRDKGDVPMPPVQTARDLAGGEERVRAAELLVASQEHAVGVPKRQPARAG